MAVESLATSSDEPSGKIDLKTWCWQDPKPGEPWWIVLARAGLRIFFIIAREFSRNAITLRAGALTFTVVLSLVPMLALGSAVLKGLGAGNEMKAIAYRVIDEIAPVTGNTSPKGETPASRKHLAMRLKEGVDRVFKYVNRTNFTTLGAIGIIALLVTVFSAIATIEDAMNAIWHAHKGRTIGRRLMNYFALVVILPIAANLAFAAFAAVASPVIWQKIKLYVPMAGFLHMGLNLLPILLVVLTFILLYMFLPNASVSVKAASIGGVAGGLCWLAVMAVYIKLQLGVARYNAIYGSFATVPLVLLWIYTGWLIFLTGAELSFAIQTWKGHVPSHLTMKPSAILALCIDVMGHVYRDFEAGRNSRVSELAKRMGYPDALIRKAVKELLAAGYLRRVYSKSRLEVLPGIAAENLEMSHVVGSFLGEVYKETPGGVVAKNAVESAKQGVASWHLSDVVCTIKEKDEKD